MVAYNKPAPIDSVRDALMLSGFSLVNRWHDSHGNGGALTFQKEIGHSLTVVSYDRDGMVKTLRNETSKGKDYLLAREILCEMENPKCGVEGPEYEEITSEGASCLTMNARVFEHFMGERFKIVSVAGHGTWAFPMGEND